mgnify:CR=1 FL=1
MAASVLMKVLYGARLVRYDLLWAVNSLAREVSRWKRGCDKRLYKLIRYLESTKDISLECFVGDDPQHCHVMNYSDADFAGGKKGFKSTTGGYIAIVGPNTFVPVTAICKK